jgi:hypothetical protein
MDPIRLEPILRAQDGVVARRQVLEAGLDDNDIERLLRRRVWARIHPGVYVDHTGAPTTTQLHWAAVLSCWPAALYGESALQAYGALPASSGRTAATPWVHVAVLHPRKVVAPPGVRVHRVVGLDAQVLWNLGPPRLRLEHAVLTTCAAAPTRSAALAIAADACQQRRTNAARLLDALEEHPRLRHGSWLRLVLHDVAAGTMSLLEHGYLRLERAHGLPAARRQRRAETGGPGPVYRDVRYPAVGVVVELDGRLGHEWTDERWQDMDRDLDAGAEGQLTIRLGWRHVMEDACRTAGRLGRVLAHRGWVGAVRACGPDCALTSPHRGRSPAPGADDRPA